MSEREKTGKINTKNEGNNIEQGRNQRQVYLKIQKLVI